MRNNGKYLLWNQMSQIVNDDMRKTSVELTVYSVMNVRLAVQALCETTSNLLSEYYGSDTYGTSQLCAYAEKFFDALSVRSPREGILNPKEFLLPYTSVEDLRFTWLENIFLQFLHNWKTSFNNREKHFNRNSKETMFWSWQTYKVLKITYYSVIEATKYLLRRGMEFVKVLNKIL